MVHWWDYTVLLRNIGFDRQWYLLTIIRAVLKTTFGALKLQWKLPTPRHNLKGNTVHTGIVKCPCSCGSLEQIIHSAVLHSGTTTSVLKEYLTPPRKHLNAAFEYSFGHWLLCQLSKLKSFQASPNDDWKWWCYTDALSTPFTITFYYFWVERHDKENRDKRQSARKGKLTIIWCILRS